MKSNDLLKKEPNTCYDPNGYVKQCISFPAIENSQLHLNSTEHENSKLILFYKAVIFEEKILCYEFLYQKGEGNFSKKEVDEFLKKIIINDAYNQYSVLTIPVFFNNPLTATESKKKCIFRKKKG